MAAKPVHILHEPLKLITREEGQEPVETLITEVELTVVRPKQMRALDSIEGDIARSIKLVAMLTGLTVSQVDDMHPKDYKALVEAAQNFS